MRRLFSLFIVLLLVLRGLLGDAMAMGEMVAVPSPSFAAALHDHGADQGPGLHTAQTDPAAHGATAADPLQHAHGSPPGEGCAAQDSSACEHAHGMSCAACGICHSAVSPTASLARAAEAAAGIRPAGLSPRFASALPLQAVKPPIS